MRRVRETNCLATPRPRMFCTVRLLSGLQFLRNKSINFRLSLYHIKKDSLDVQYPRHVQSFVFCLVPPYNIIIHCVFKWAYDTISRVQRFVSKPATMFLRGHSHPLAHKSKINVYGENNAFTCDLQSSSYPT